LVLLAILTLPTLGRAQQHTEIVRGRVTTDSGAPITDATIIATRAPDRTSFTARSDSGGQYILSIPGGTGDYLVHISASGRTAFRQRVTRAVGSADTVFTLDAHLSRARPAQLARVVIQAKKTKPERRSDPGTETGASEVLPDDFSPERPPDLAGDLATIASAIPGVTATTNGISVLGLNAAQSSTTLGGMAFGGGSLPRAARTHIRVSTTTYDPARGWFGGANTNVELESGSVFTTRSAFATLDAPALQTPDPVASALGQRFASIRSGVGGSGPLGRQDRYFYSYGVEAARRTSDAISLLDADASLLRQVGVSPDSIARLTRIMGDLGLPPKLASVPRVRARDQVSLLMRLDYAPLDARTLRPPKRTAAITLFGSGSRSAPFSLGATALPSYASRNWDRSVGAQALLSTYFGKDYLATLRSSLSVRATRDAPYLAAPAGDVLVASTDTTGIGSIAQLQIGASPYERDRRTSTWETIADVQLYATGHESHRISLTADARLDADHDAEIQNARGAYSYNSLADLASNRAASFTRTLNAPARQGREWNAFAAVGDLWRVTPTLRVQYGGRIEGNVFLDPPSYNASLEQTLGVRNDYAPRGLHVSPRLGFTWVRRGAGNIGSIRFNNLGAFNGAPSSYIRGGIGEFRSITPPTLLSEASSITGLPDASRSIRCVGTAVPRPDWARYADDPGAIPTQCADGSDVLADSAPAVRLVDRGYAPPRSWRANLSYASQQRWLVYSVEGTYSLNLDQTGVVNLNFSDVTRFTAVGEGRLVFAPVGSIVPTSGSISTVGTRRSARFSDVLATHSSLRSATKQLIVTAAPDVSSSDNVWASLSYVLSSTRSLESGFDGSTFGSPLERSWGRGPLDARHQFVLRGGYGRRGVAFSLYARVIAGLPYTPLIGGDVNGDGLWNDRAFVQDPATTDDPVTATSMASLLSSSPARTRDCLVRQLGQPAARGSCEGPWSTIMNAQVTLRGSALHAPKWLGQLTLNFANPLAGIDQMLHGSRLHGWGSPATPDPRLYYVDAFDPGTRKFLYRVNPRFGSTDAARTLARSPFRVTLDVSLYLSPDFPQQQLVRYLGAGRGGRPGPRLTERELKQRYERNVGDPYRAIMAESDSLLLTREQVEALQRVDAAYRQQMDSLWQSLASDFVALGEHFDVTAAVKRQEGAIAAAREMTRLHVRATLGEILTAVQIRLMPGSVREMYRSSDPLAPGGRTYTP
jgi:hypothetical protein